jgi:cytochrome d ubiquinol oxidase subunit I
LLLHGDRDAPVVGLDRFRPEDRPPVVVPFLAYHLMVGLGLFFVGVTLLACFFWWRGTLFAQRWLLWIYVFAVLGAVAANQAGWVAAEVGRQPWVVHPPIPRSPDGELALGPAGVVEYDERQGLRTRDGVSRSVRAQDVRASIALFGAIYLLLGAVWVMVLNDKIQKGPEPLPAGAAGGAGFVEAAARRPSHAASLTEAPHGEADRSS